MPKLVVNTHLTIENSHHSRFSQLPSPAPSSCGHSRRCHCPHHLHRHLHDVHHRRHAHYRVSSRPSMPMLLPRAARPEILHRSTRRSTAGAPPAYDSGHLHMAELSRRDRLILLSLVREEEAQRLRSGRALGPQGSRTQRYTTDGN